MTDRITCSLHVYARLVGERMPRDMKLMEQTEFNVLLKIVNAIPVYQI